MGPVVLGVCLLFFFGRSLAVPVRSYGPPSNSYSSSSYNPYAPPSYGYGSSYEPQNTYGYSQNSYGSSQSYYPPNNPYAPQAPSYSSAICSGQPDGKYSDPYEPCAQHFYFCNGGNEVKQDCPPGGTYFDEISGDCLKKEYVQACGGVHTYKPEPTTHAPRSPPFSYDCYGKPDGDYENPTEACSEWYVSCVAGEAILRDCQPGLAFDETTGKCSDPHYVPWCGGYYTEAAPTSPAPHTYAPYEFDCWGLADGDYKHPHEYCSSQYVSCVGQEPVYRECPGTLKFDSYSGDCLAAKYIEDCGGYATPKPAPTYPAPLPDPGYEFDCYGKDDGDYENPHETCSEYYYSCSGGVATYRWCQSGLVFDVISNSCLDPHYVEWCGGYATTTYAPYYHEQKTAPFTYECWDKEDGDYDNPSEPCSAWYVSCSGGEATYRECPSGLVFDWESKKCLSSGYVSACGGYPTQETPSAHYYREPADYDCYGLEDGYYEKAYCSESYYACVGGISQEVWCPASLVYDSLHQQCDNPAYVESCGGTPTYKPPEEPSYYGTPDYHCEEYGVGSYPAEEGCTAYYFVCKADNTKVDKQCDYNTYFDAESQQCLWRRDVVACGGTPYVPDAYAQSGTYGYGSAAAYDCSGLADGKYGTQCDSVYYECKHYQLAGSGYCSYGEIFDSKYGDCVDKAWTYC